MVWFYVLAGFDLKSDSVSSAWLNGKMFLPWHFQHFSTFFVLKEEWKVFKAEIPFQKKWKKKTDDGSAFWVQDWSLWRDFFGPSISWSRIIFLSLRTNSHFAGINPRPWIWCYYTSLPYIWISPKKYFIGGPSAIISFQAWMHSVCWGTSKLCWPRWQNP